MFFSFLQVRRAYQRYFGKLMREDLTYEAAGHELIKALGLKAAQKFIGNQSNDPNAKED